MGKGGDELARGRIPELGAVIRARRQDPSAVRTETPHKSRSGWAKEAISLPEAASQSLAVSSALAVRIRAPSGLNAPLSDPITRMGKGSDELARGRIPELRGIVCACRQDPSTIRTKRRVGNRILMGKGNDELARGRIPELGGFVRACREDPSTVRTERRVLDAILMWQRRP